MLKQDPALISSSFRFLAAFGVQILQPPNHAPILRDQHALAQRKREEAQFQECAVILAQERAQYNVAKDLEED